MRGQGNGAGRGLGDDSAATAATTTAPPPQQPPPPPSTSTADKKKQKHKAMSTGSKEARRRSRSPSFNSRHTSTSNVAAAAASAAAGFFRRLRRKGDKEVVVPSTATETPAAAPPPVTMATIPPSLLAELNAHCIPPSHLTPAMARELAAAISGIAAPAPVVGNGNDVDDDEGEEGFALPVISDLPPHPPPHAALAPLRMGAATNRGSRPYQEDRHACVAPLAPLDSAGLAAGEPQENLPRSYAAVFDGHSGSDAASLASERLHALLAREPALRLCSGSGNPGRALGSDAPLMAAALRAAFASVDAEILARCRGRGGREGTTALVALRVGRQLWTAHLGDARAVLARVEREKKTKKTEKKKEEKGSKDEGEEKLANGDAAAAAATAEDDAAATAAAPKEEGAKAVAAAAPASSTSSDDDQTDDDDDDEEGKRAGPTIITRSPQSPLAAAAAPNPPRQDLKSHLPPFLRSLWQHTHQNGSGSNTTTAAAAAAAAAAKNAPSAAPSQPLPPSSSNSRVKAVRLTHDHKPDLPHERARVLAAGGRVEWQGCWRVVAESPLPGRPAAGLAVSRSLGDAQFKEPLPLVSCDPDVSVTLLRPGDTLLILASDGVWDVLSDQDAAEVAVAAALKAAAAEEVEEEEEGKEGGKEGGKREDAKASSSSDVKGEGGANADASASASAKDGAQAGPAEDEEEKKKKKKEAEEKEEKSDDDDEDPSSLGLNVPLRSGFCPIATAAAEAVIAAALSRGTMDNVTALCAVLPWEW